MKEHPSLPFTFHVSGPLLLWWEDNDTSMLDLIGEMIDSGQIEPLMGGFYEPILASLPPDDRRGQISMMREYLRKRFGITPAGLWLAERVWDGEIIKDLVSEGVRYVLVDDRHFKVSGFKEDELSGYYLTESVGHPLAIFPIGEQLRYLIPFRPVNELEDYLRSIQGNGGSVAIYGDDGEKMGGWPGTAGWVYRDGWLASFLNSLVSMKEEFLDLRTCSQVMDEEKPLGICYLPTASYTEMEGWALPAGRLISLADLTERLGDQYPDDLLFVRGGHWKNFLVKYPEANLLHKKVLRLSNLIHNRKLVPGKVIEELYAAQCNDAYWHGVFGGLYLPHLRGAAWERISRVEKYLRVGEDLTFEVTDLDLDGREELWAHSYQFSAVIRPEAGGRISEYTYLPHGNNYCNVIARRFEAYHNKLSADGDGNEGEQKKGRASIHDLSKRIPSDVRKALLYDNTPRGLFIDRFFNEAGGVGEYQRSQLSEFGNFPSGDYRWKQLEAGILVEREEVLSGDQGGNLGVQRELTFTPEGEMLLNINVTYQLIPSELCYGIELSLSPPHIFRGHGIVRVNDRDLKSVARPYAFEDVRSIRFGMEEASPHLQVEWSPLATLWCYPIFTVSQSESGFEKTLQGLTILPFWQLSEDGGATFSANVQWKFVE
jgi:alpha-amylase